MRYDKLIHLALLLAICFVTDPIEARSRRSRNTAPPPKSYDRSCKGTILGVSDKAILMRQVDDKGSDYQPLIVIWPSRTIVRVTGEADPSFLSKGQHIRFTATLADIQNGPLQLDRLEMLSPETDPKPGVQPAAGGNPNGPVTVIARVTSSTV